MLIEDADPRKRPIPDGAETEVPEESLRAVLREVFAASLPQAIKRSLPNPAGAAPKASDERTGATSSKRRELLTL
jgi:hypothetical protein